MAARAHPNRAAPQRAVTPSTSDVPRLILQTARDLRTALDRRMAAHGLTFQQAAVVVRCVRADGVRPAQLAPHLGTDRAGLTRLVDRLVAAGLVTRATSDIDRRTVVLAPTKAARDLTPALEAVIRRTRRDALAGLSDAEHATLQSLLGRVLANAHDLVGS